MGAYADYSAFNASCQRQLFFSRSSAACISDVAGDDFSTLRCVENKKREGWCRKYADTRCINGPRDAGKLIDCGNHMLNASNHCPCGRKIVLCDIRMDTFEFRKGCLGNPNLHARARLKNVATFREDANLPCLTSSALRASASLSSAVSA